MKQRIIIALSALFVVVAMVGVWQAWTIRGSEAGTNHALTDVTSSAQVEQAATAGLQQVLSYDYSDPATTEAAAQKWLVGGARTDYETLYRTLKEKAPEQQLQLTAQVQTVGIKTLWDSKATALVFLDQSSQRATDKEASISAAQLAVSLVKRDGDWKISSLKPL